MKNTVSALAICFSWLAMIGWVNAETELSFEQTLLQSGSCRFSGFDPRLRKGEGAEETSRVDSTQTNHIKGEVLLGGRRSLWLKVEEGTRELTSRNRSRYDDYVVRKVANCAKIKEIRLLDSVRTVGAAKEKCRFRVTVLLDDDRVEHIRTLMEQGLTAALVSSAACGSTPVEG